MVKKSRPSLLAAAAAAMELPAEAAVGVPVVELVGNRELRMENHRGVLAYAEEEITVSGKGQMVRIRGEKLKIGAMSPVVLVVRGEIKSVELE